MIAAAVIVALLAILGLLVWSLLRHSGGDSSDVCYLNTQESEVDVEVLALLLSRNESEYLRRSLPPQEFRRIKRQRLSLARTYLHAINRNTGEFIRAAEAARSSSDAETARAAHEMLQIAFRVRLNVPIVEFCLLTEWLFPGLNLIAAPRLNVYREMMAKIVFVLQRLPSAQSTIRSAG